MSTTPNPLRTFLLGRARQVPAVLDPADMGTCFGLEMTLDQPEADVFLDPSPTRPWWQRLAGRRPQGT
jgi:hypothetical protein